MTAAYDGLNRITSRSYSDGTPSAVFCYDGTTWAGPASCTMTRSGPNIGLLTWAGALTGGTPNSTSYAYNVLGLPITTTQTTEGQPFTLDYTYYRSGSPSTLTYPSLGGAVRRQITWTHDEAGRLSTIWGVKSPEPAKYYLLGSNYGPFGGLNSRQLGNTRYQHVNLNSRLQATEIGLGTSPSDNSIFGLTLGYSLTQNNGNLASQTISAPGFSKMQNYGYDALNRLTSAMETNSWYQTFGYDRYGNQWISGHNLPSSVVNALTPTSQAWYNPSNNRITAFNYDYAGNQTSAVSPMDWVMTYDAENHMTGARYASMYAGALSYVYDALGQRVKKTVDQTSGIYVYDAGGQLVAEYTKNGAGSYTLLKEFVYGGGLLAVEMATTGATEYLTTDHLGSTRVVTDASGNVVSRHDYLPFGKEVPLSYRTGVAGYISPERERVLQRFTGDEVDPETGLGYFVNRYYSGRMGRFTSPDPLGIAAADVSNPQSLNAYAYVLNNPLLYVDPLGLGAESPTCKYRITVDDRVIYCGDNAATYELLACQYGGYCNGNPAVAPGSTSVGPGPKAAQRAPANNRTSAADIARCAAQKANSVSLAALLPERTPTIVSNIFGNDFSTISNLITGPGRVDAAVSVAEGKALNATVRGVGAIRYTADKFILGTNGAGTTFARDLIPGTIAGSAAGTLAGKILTKVSAAKLIYDASTYAGAAAKCYVSPD